ncbi:MAG: MerR family transcriptional regulator [Anaerolineales bacterium]|jgi:DNA-binding transcriptional MerR regulator
MPYTIKEIADLAGVTTRTIRYYDEIGLLTPSDTGDNGYRYYDQENLLLLQQIMFFRELEVPLKDIQLILNRPEFNLVSALKEHRSILQAKADRINTLIETVDQTIATIKGEWEMSDKEYFEGFDETKYEEEAKQRWGNTSQWKESRKKWASYSEDQKQAIKVEGGEITKRMVGNDKSLSPDDPEVQGAVGEYYAYINKYFYTCDVNFLRGLADMWVEDPRFAINYERIREGGAAFVREAVHIFCDQNG